MYEIATAPLRKCMLVVAGTPVCELPYALVMIVRPFFVAWKITALIP
jgi:hypothetical protein